MQSGTGGRLCFPRNSVRGYNRLERYVTSEDIKRFGSIEERRQSLSVDGWLGQEWLAK